MHPKDTQFDHWIRWFVSDRGPTATPFRLSNGATAATDGRIAIRTPEPYAHCEAVQEKYRRKTEIIFDISPIHESSVSREEALAMFGACDHPVVTKCPECNGTKWVPHICACERCGCEREPCDCTDGSDVEMPELRPALLWGHPFDRNRIAYLLEHAPASERYGFGLIADSGTNIIRVTADSWQACVCGLAESKETMERVTEELMMAATGS